ncbi:MAG: sugar phosphate isomerase/epimerase [Tetrasphaera sp.]
MSPTLGSLDGRVAAAPISWGICEVPGWGEVMPSERVLSEMHALGIPATELGAPGFLPEDAETLKTTLAAHDLGLVGGFVPLVLHDPAQREDALRRATEVAELFQAAGATMFVTALVQDYDWSKPIPLSATDMQVVGEGLKQVGEVCAAHGLTQVLHPHVDTVVETKRDVDLALEHTDVLWCLDTGHLQIGGVDPVAFAREHAGRVGLVHLKDVDTATSARVLSGELSLVEGVQAGMMRRLGDGEVAIADAVVALEEGGYRGWYALEQDTALKALPGDGEGPVHDVEACLSYLADNVVPRLSATA